MPNTPGAKKRMRQTEKRRLRNRSVIRNIKEQIKTALATAKAGNPDQLRADVSKAVQQLDKAASKRVIHRNLAARKKSQLARLLNRKGAQ